MRNADKPRAYSWFAAIVVLTGVAALLAGAARLHAARTKRINVLLLTLDTTRADRLGCYGYAPAETPALDRLASGGLRFTRAFTHLPLTCPAHASLLSGLLPPEHGMRVNGYGRISEDIELLPEIFQRRGYRTAAFLASTVLDRGFGLNQGFEVYDDRMTSPGQEENRADVVCDRALNWLAKNRRKPFFCWVHFYDPHDRYDPPEPYRSRHDHPYDGEIAFMDSQIQRLLHFLEEQRLGGATLVVACGDHGEAFGEHGEITHQLLVYDEVMRVPLILRLPGVVPVGTADRVAGLADIPATVMDILEWNEHGFGTESLVADDGQEALCYGESLAGFYDYHWAPLYSLTARPWKYIQAPTPELYDLVADPGETRNLVREKSGIARNMAGQLRTVRANMQAAPASSPVLNATAASRLRSLGYVAGSPTMPPAPEEEGRLRDPKTAVPIHALCSYAETLMDEGKCEQVVERIRPALAVSPESPTIHRLIGRAYLGLGRYAEARTHILQAYENSIYRREEFLNAADAFFEKGRPEIAIELYDQVLRAVEQSDTPRSPSGASPILIRTRCNMGLALMTLERLDEAIRHFRDVLRMDPEHVVANNNLGTAYRLQGKPGLAIEQLQKTLAIAPDAIEVRRNLGALLGEAGRHREALTVWREGLKLRPREPIFTYHLVWLLATSPAAGVRNGREALRLARPLWHDAGGQSIEALDTLAVAYAETADYPHAAETARRALALATQGATPHELTGEIRQRLRLYEASRPFRQRSGWPAFASVPAGREIHAFRVAKDTTVSSTPPP